MSGPFSRVRLWTEGRLPAARVRPPIPEPVSLGRWAGVLRGEVGGEALWLTAGPADESSVPSLSPAKPPRELVQAHLAAPSTFRETCREFEQFHQRVG
jgi:hypothetical protein